MSLTFLGQLTIGDMLPGVYAPLFAAAADLQARIAALLQFQATVSLDLTAQIELAAQITASLEAALTLGLTAPSLSAQISIVADLTVAIQLQLQLILDLFGLFATAGVWVWHYNGRADTLGSDLTTALTAGLPAGGGPAESIDALVMATNAAATWAAISAIFKTTP